jgi:hypothetical protein
VTALFFEKEYEFFRGQGVPPLAAPKGGSILRKQSRSFLVVYENKALNTAVFFIDEIEKKFTEPRGLLREKAT